MSHTVKYKFCLLENDLRQNQDFTVNKFTFEVEARGA